jgi:hypothetical protein
MPEKADPVELKVASPVTAAEEAAVVSSRTIGVLLRYHIGLTDARLISYRLIS